MSTPPSQSIQTRLTRSYFTFFILVAALGAASLGMISYDNQVSGEIRERWLQNALYIGDFENFTSDYRLAEESALQQTPAAENPVSNPELDYLGKLITQAQLRFARIPNDGEEAELFHQFQQEWTDYMTIEGRIFTKISDLDRSTRKALFQGESRDTYQRISGTLEKLRKFNIQKISDAGRRSEQVNMRVLWLLCLAVVLTNILAYVASVHVRRSIFNPLVELIASMRQLAQNKTEIPLNGTERPDEIGDMARALLLFRDNILHLARSQKQLEQQAIALQENLMAEQNLSLHQRNFVAMASHEFRTPLNIIDGQAQRLHRHKAATTAEEVETRTRAIRGAVLRITNMIDALLDRSVLADGGTQLYATPQAADMTALLHDVCQQHSDIAPHMRINQNFPATPLPCMVDAKLIFQAFSNIIGNSVKYSGPNGVIDVDVSRTETSFSIVFCDNGLGIEPDDLPRIFDRHFRGRNVSGIVGTGLGLFLVKAVMDLHSGSVTVTSDPGHGVRTVITLPLANPAASA